MENNSDTVRSRIAAARLMHFITGHLPGSADGGWRHMNGSFLLSKRMHLPVKHVRMQDGASDEEHGPGTPLCAARRERGGSAPGSGH